MATNQIHPDMSSERLTSLETTQMTIGPAISTVTFFRGNPAAATEILRARLAEVVSANPWLCGTLSKKKGELQLCYSPTPSADQVAGLFNPTRRGGKVKPMPVLNSTMDFMQICQAVGGSAAEILKGSSCINKPEPLVALSVVPDAKTSKDTFAVIFSVSHVIVDGFNYYQLLSMLSSGSSISALSAKRKHEIIQQSKTAMGAKESAFTLSGAVICNVICSMLCGKKPMIESFYIDDAKVKAAKEVAKGTESGVDFVSTNDILCSTFANATGARVLLMPLNFRDRLPNFTASDAGNYEGALVFGPEDYASPSLIRKTLKSGPPAYARCVAKPLPGCCEAMRCNMAMMTNWCFPFFSEVKIEGCEQMLHLPFADTKMVPFDIGVVYRPKAGKTAVVFFVRSIDAAGIKIELPVGAQVPCAEEFHASALSNA